MRRPWETLRTLCYPQRNHCHLCETALTAGDGCLCARCTLHLSWLRIHSPQDLAGLNQSLAAYQHLAQARQLILQLKYQGNGAAAEPLAEGMCDLLIDFWPRGGFDVAVPVPMHPTRQAERGYNQAAVLARAVCRHLPVPLDETSLARVRDTTTQVSADREQRARALQGAFRSARLEGKRVLLIDDVVTTGSTAAACAEALKEAGARSVWLLAACEA